MRLQGTIRPDGRYDHHCEDCGFREIVRTEFLRHECEKRDPFGCKWLGKATEETVECKGCPGSKRVHALFQCEIHTKCLPLTRVDGVRYCQICGDYELSGSTLAE